MKDFDAERAERHEESARLNPDRDFKIAGKTFTYKPNVRYNSMQALAATTDGKTDFDTLIRALESCACAMIEDDPDEFLAALRSDNGELPVTYEDLNVLVTWLVEEQVKRPTSALSSSTDGRATTGTDSTATSSSPQEEAPTS